VHSGVALTAVRAAEGRTFCTAAFLLGRAHHLFSQTQW